MRNPVAMGSSGELERSKCIETEMLLLFSLTYSITREKSNNEVTSTFSWFKQRHNVASSYIFTAVSMTLSMTS